MVKVDSANGSEGDDETNRGGVVLSTFTQPEWIRRNGISSCYFPFPGVRIELGSPSDLELEECSLRPDPRSFQRLISALLHQLSSAPPSPPPPLSEVAGCSVQLLPFNKNDSLA